MKIEQVIESLLQKVKDPSLNLSAKELSLKEEIKLENNQVILNLKSPIPHRPLEKTLIPELEKALVEALPDYQFKITIDSFIRAHRTQLPGKGLRGVKNTIAVASGKGGVGKSTVTVNLAIALAKAGARVGVLDADIYGPSVPLMLGEVSPVVTKDEGYLPVSAHGIQAMSIGYLTDSNEALIWRGPMLAKSLIQMLDITLWDELDYLLIDLPPGTGDIQLSLVQKIPLAGAIVVTTPQNVATLDAQKAIKMFEKTNIDVLGLVENMSLHHCSQCGHPEAIFGTGGAKALSESFKLPFLGELPLNARIQSDCDKGQPTASYDNDALAEPFNMVALKAALSLASKPINYANQFPDIVVE
ncbi:MAG: iron-sulfur cluster carrier protein ApbC [Proteobacteria bacterium]|nr:iron-sulfur cluster carrier protein ApbC [Pseudomonadota bacterium]